MKFFQKIIMTTSLFLLAQSTSFAQGFTPESGFWWNPDEPGYGYTIEIQDNFMFVAFYVYDEFGNPIWYSAGKRLSGQGGNSFFDSELDRSINGTCIDCGFSQSTVLLGDRGPVTIDFLTETTATIQFQGAITDIERFNFSLGDELGKMRGEWQIITDESNLFQNGNLFADVIIFDSFGSQNGIELVEGCRSASVLGNNCSSFNNPRAVAASYDANTREHDILVDHTNDLFILYRVRVGTGQFDGDTYVYQKGTIPDLSVDGFIARGFRSGSRTFVDSGQGPSQVNPEQKTEIEQRHSENILTLSETIDDIKTDSKNAKAYEVLKKLEAQIEAKKANK